MKLDILNKSRKEIFINMQHETFKGNVLDIGMDNYGIIYSLYKKYNEEAAVDYVYGKDEKKLIDKEGYDSCVMLFSLKNIWLKVNKRKFLKDISTFLKDNGVIYIWDIDKGYSKVFRAKIKIMLAERKLKEIVMDDFNLVKDNSKESTIKLLQEYFEIIDLKASDNIYYIKAKKKSLKTKE
ncbi:class I SAM-dependent methyltransferase [Clostridium sp. YIM B02515]|uniref:Class I SAM-dependent methyltransferase n=1 Tax=Clostridium rhizosphaerae TaxID=2803861 RepID=A0ABS1T7D1_9CLOT|nr:class I SAM-dependent methyltransferase [Clostridium rhizosphaerae]MBL4935251.1 class I SAM-dependent methyltransferase [Clostridium rhizosphaerae]